MKSCNKCNFGSIYERIDNQFNTTNDEIPVPNSMRCDYRGNSSPTHTYFGAAL